MKKHLLKLSFLIVTASMFCACDSFLDKQPSATSNAPITEVSQLLSLYDYVTNTYEYDYPGVYAPMITVCPWHCTMLVPLLLGLIR